MTFCFASITRSSSPQNIERLTRIWANSWFDKNLWSWKKTRSQRHARKYSCNPDTPPATSARTYQMLFGRRRCNCHWSRTLQQSLGLSKRTISTEQMPRAVRGTWEVSNYTSSITFTLTGFAIPPRRPVNAHQPSPGTHSQIAKRHAISVSENVLGQPTYCLEKTLSSDWRKLCHLTGENSVVWLERTWRRCHHDSVGWGGTIAVAILDSHSFNRATQSNFTLSVHTHALKSMHAPKIASYTKQLYSRKGEQFFSLNPTDVHQIAVWIQIL